MEDKNTLVNSVDLDTKTKPIKRKPKSKTKVAPKKPHLRIDFDE
ncbi:Putative uncharacterized protein [Moritella viscosa]|nr:Putative uncharacterized protein [Moritella viscosa]